MALSRRTGARFQASIWPGFVDAMTGLLLVLMFVLTIFMVVQFVLREEISGQASKLDELSSDVAALSRSLGLAQDRNADLNEQVGTLTATLGDAQARAEEQNALIAALRRNNADQAAALDTARSQISEFEAQVAGLLAQRETNQSAIAALEGARDALLSEQDRLQLALAGLREEVDAQAETARLAAARREALEALVANLRAENATAQGDLATQLSEIDDLQIRLSDEQEARLVEAAAAEALRARLQDADAELGAMTLALEAQRREAEETLALLAAANSARATLDTLLDEALAERDAARSGAQSAEELRADLAAALAAKLAAEQEAEARLNEAEQRAALLAQAQAELAGQQELASEAQQQQTLLNQQVAALRTQLGELQALLDDAKDREAASEVQLQSLGSELNTALARVAAEERRRRESEAEEARLRAERDAAERARLEAEKADLERFRSEFFGRLRELLEGQEGVQIVGDRFVFSSEVLFAPGEAALSADGQAELAQVAGLLLQIAEDIPPEIDWVIQVDGHTDNVPIRGSGIFSDNWSLSQARALSVVRYMIDTFGIPPQRLSANGFGEFQPINPDDTPEARAQNRRIELKLTER